MRLRVAAAKRFSQNISIVDSDRELASAAPNSHKHILAGPAEPPRDVEDVHRDQQQHDDPGDAKMQLDVHVTFLKMKTATKGVMRNSLSRMNPFAAVSQARRE